MRKPTQCQHMMEDGEICGAEHRNHRTHQPGMSREEHARGAKDMRTDPSSHNPLRTQGVKTTHQPLTGQQRAEFAMQRELIVGETITQRGRFEGMTILSHIRGSQYLVGDRRKHGMIVDTERFYAYHKKQSKDGSDIKAELAGGWRPWRQDWHDKGEAKIAAMEAMDEAVRDGAAQEDEAATMAPPTPSSDQTRVELKAIRLDLDHELLWAVFEVAGTLYHGALRQFNPTDLIKREDER